MWRASGRSFVRGQGFLDVDEASSAGWYKALMFQAKVIGVAVAAGIAIQRAEWFLALSAILWWNALLPALNPFDALYNAMIAVPPRTPCLEPAPAPRRFAQGMVATFVLVIGISLLQGWSTIAWIAEALIVVALLDLFLRRFCLGSAVFNLIHRSNTSASAEETRPT
jgi:Domain of unknown function (DUF4395)